MAFQSVEHLIDCAQHQPLWQAVLLDDCQDRDVTQEESFARMEALWQAMVESVEHYDPQRRSASGLSGGQGEKMAQAQNTLCGPDMQQVIATALKVGEHNACMGRIVAAPTAGASGVMPAVLLPLWKREGLSTHTMVECLYVAAGFGQVIATRASISGAEGGCQAEIGSASGMAAAALVHARGGGAQQMAAACAMALHATILARPHWQRDKASLQAVFEEVATRALAPNATTMASALACRALAYAIAGPEAQESISNTCKILCEERMEGFASDEGESERTLAGIHELSAPGCRRFSVTAHKPERLVWNLSVTGYDRGVPASSANGMEVKRRYLDSFGREVTEIRTGDVVTVEIGLRSDTPLDNVVVCDLLPGGLEPQLAQGEQLPWYVDHVERREDRMLFFVSTAGDMRLVTYRARAVTSGTFSVPVVHAEAMYQPDMEASTAGGKLHIVKR